MTLRRLLPLAILPLLGWLPALTALPARAGVVAAEQGDSVLVFEALARGRDWPELVLPGHPSAGRDLSLVRRWVRDAEGSWSAGGRLPAPLSGIPFQHGHRPWLARLVDLGARGPIVEVGPLSLRDAVEHSAIPRDPRATAVLVAASDPWHFRVVELLADGTVTVSEHTSHGPLRQLEATQSFQGRPDWPEGTRLLAVAGPTGQPLVFARGPAGTLRAGRPGVHSWTSLPDLDLDPDLAVAGLQVGNAPAAVVAGRGLLSLWRLAGIAWERHGSTEVPAAPASWTAVGAEAPLALRLAEDGLQAWGWSEGRWRRETVPTGEAPTVVAAPPLESRADAARDRAPRATLVIVLLGITGGLGLALALVLTRGRRAG